MNRQRNSFLLASALTIMQQMAQADLTVFCYGGGKSNYLSYEKYEQAGELLTCAVFQLLCIETGVPTQLVSYSYDDAVECQTIYKKCICNNDILNWRGETTT